MNDAPDADESRRKYDALADTYDNRLPALRRPQEALRRLGVQGLALRPGETVLDIGCGTGASLASLVAAVGINGKVIGIEPSGRMMAVARQLVERSGWTNVELIEAGVPDGPLPAADAAFLFFTHDVLRTRGAGEALAAALAPHGRVRAVGACRPSGWRSPFGLLAWLLMRPFVTTSEGMRAPWSLFDEHFESTVETSAFGSMFLYTGHTRASAEPKEGA